MQIKGTIIALLLPLQMGQGKNGEWKKRIYYRNKRTVPEKVCITAWGKTVDYVPSIGTEVNVSFDIESREYNGRYYTEVKAFKIESVGKKLQINNQAHVRRI